MNLFKDYRLYERDADGHIIAHNPKAITLANEAFELFKSVYDCNYGSIEEDDNLIAIHTGGWSDNEALIEQFDQTAWWWIHHKITAKGGHYYFDTDYQSEKKWEITKNQNNDNKRKIN